MGYECGFNAVKKGTDPKDYENNEISICSWCSAGRILTDTLNLEGIINYDYEKYQYPLTKQSILTIISILADELEFTCYNVDRSVVQTDDDTWVQKDIDGVAMFGEDRDEYKVIYAETDIPIFKHNADVVAMYIEAIKMLSKALASSIYDEYEIFFWVSY